MQDFSLLTSFQATKTSKNLIPPPSSPHNTSVHASSPTYSDQMSNHSFIESDLYPKLQEECHFPRESEDNPLYTLVNPTSQSQIEDYAKDYFHSCQCQGPSFYQKKTYKEDKDFLCPCTTDIWNETIERQAMDSGMDLATSKELAFNSNTLNNSKRGQSQYSGPAPLLRQASLEAWSPSKALGLLSVNSSSCQVSENHYGEFPVRQQEGVRPKMGRSNTMESQSKKRKVESGDSMRIWEENIDVSGSQVLKLKHSKSEFNNSSQNTATYLVRSTMPANFFIFNGSNGECNYNNAAYLQTQTLLPPNNIKLFSPWAVNSGGADYLCENNRERDDRSTDISSNRSTLTKLEDSPNFVRLLPTQSSSYEFGGGVGYQGVIQGNLGNMGNMGQQVLHQQEIIGKIEKKMIGPLTIEERREKIEKYLAKRKQRSWNKKISYDCRKRVADSRLRIRGRFVTKSRAFEILEADGVNYDPNKITLGEIKEYLNKKFMECPKNHENGGKMSRFAKSFSFEEQNHNQELEGGMYCGMNEEFSLSPQFGLNGGNKYGFPFN